MTLLMSKWRYLFAVGALGVLVVAVGPSELTSVLAGARLWLVGLYAVGLGLTSVLYATQVWVVLRQAGQPIDWWTTTRGAVTSWSVGLITPARAGDLSLPLLLRESVPGSLATAVVVTEKLMSLAWLATVALVVSIGLAVDTAAVALVAGVVLAAVLASLAITRTAWLARILGRVLPIRLRPAAADTAEAMGLLIRQFRFLAFTLAAITVRWGFVFALNLLLFAAIGHHPPLVHVVAATAIGRLLALLPISVGGLGVKEPVQIVIYALADIPAQAVVAVSVLGMAANYLVAAVLPVVVGRSRMVAVE